MVYVHLAATVGCRQMNDEEISNSVIGGAAFLSILNCNLDIPPVQISTWMKI